MAYRKLSRVALGTRMWCMLKKQTDKQTINKQTVVVMPHRSHRP